MQLTVKQKLFFQLFSHPYSYQGKGFKEKCKKNSKKKKKKRLHTCIVLFQSIATSLIQRLVSFESQLTYRTGWTQNKVKPKLDPSGNIHFNNMCVFLYIQQNLAFKHYVPKREIINVSKTSEQEKWKVSLMISFLFKEFFSQFNCKIDCKRSKKN